MGWRRDELGDQDRHIYMTMYKKGNNEKLLYSTENSTWCSVVTEMGKKSIMRMCMYLWVIHFYGQQKLTQRYKAAILQ